MVIDTSALLAILWEEGERERFLEAIRGAPTRLMSAVSAYEAAVVVFARRKRSEDVAALWELLQSLRIQIVPFGYEEATDAVVTYERYGKGIHPAGLNICDCPAYSLARSQRLPLLFQGGDFSQTDVVSATDLP
ncbi:MAG: type II toxin-antitoxin system VapC family toxin [Bryobacterales bacterium]|nr:type II toxin-antitoxin system VapC family toxin [Bryobacterales bacterium]